MEAILDFLWNNIEIILGFVLSIGVIGLYANKLRGLLRQVAELFIAIDDGLADGKLNQSEILKIKNEALDVWNEIKGFGKKK